MKEPDRWDLSCARMALLAARLEGLSVILRPDGLPGVRGGIPSLATDAMLKAHRDAIVWHLRQQSALKDSRRRIKM